MAEYAVRRSIPLEDGWDVIVVGGGPAGCTAAAAAAREGAKTLLLEATGILGGMGTSGMVPGFCPFTDGEKIIYSGLARHVFERNLAGQLNNPQGNIHGHTPINQEKLRRIYDDLVLQAGVTVLFHTRLTAVELASDGVIDALLVAQKEGLVAYRAKIYVDCTGDGDLAAWAGAEFELGDPATGETMPPTLCSIMSNVDTYEYTFGRKLFTWYKTGESPIWDVMRSGRYPEIPDSGLCATLVGPATVGFNASHVFDVDATNTASITAAMFKGRKTAAALRDALAEFHPRAFGNAHLVTTAPLLGVRESRRIMGDYKLTFDDYLARRTFDDEICRNCYHADMHYNYEKHGRFTDFQSNYDKIFNLPDKQGGRYATGESHGIPYRCLTPHGIKNLLVGGRQISCDRITLTSVRVMPVCMSTGEAAGVAAALAAADAAHDVHGVPVPIVRARLQVAGAYLP